MKQRLSEVPILGVFKESTPVEVWIDTSDVAIGRILVQEGKPLAFESKKAKEAREELAHSGEGNGSCSVLFD